MKKSVLIFGIDGFVGPYLAQEFFDHGYEVYGSDLEETGSIPPFASFRQCDLLDSEKVLHLIQSVNPGCIVNLAAISSVGLSWKIPQKTIAVNVGGALNILEAARMLAGPPRILLIGSSEEYATSSVPINEQSELNASNPYGMSKMMQEQFSKLYRERYGMKVYHVRAFNHTGVGQKESFVIPSWCKQAAEISSSGKPGTMRVGNLDVKRDFSHVKDVARAYRMILESEDAGVVYNVGSGNAIHLQEVLGQIMGLSEQPISIIVDRDLFRPTDNPIICCDHRLITNRLGWHPQYALQDAIKEMFEFYI